MTSRCRLRKTGRTARRSPSLEHTNKSDGIRFERRFWRGGPCSPIPTISDPVLDAVERYEGSVCQIARRFVVSLSFLVRLLRTT